MYLIKYYTVTKNKKVPKNHYLLMLKTGRRKYDSFSGSYSLLVEEWFGVHNLMGGTSSALITCYRVKR